MQRLQTAEDRATAAEQQAAYTEEQAARYREQMEYFQEELQVARIRISVANENKERAEQQALQAERRAIQAEVGAQYLHQQSANLELRARQAEERAERAEERLRAVPPPGETRQFWMVPRKEIQLTSRELGKGGWAEVRIAKFRGLQVAAKCLHSILISDYNHQLFMREMNIAATVHHPNLVLFMGATLEGNPIILMELLPTSLRAILERGPLNPLQIRDIGVDVARALVYLHGMKPQPLIHRDISSANVLLEPRPNNTWRAKVSDYGSANFLQALNTVGPGSPVYAAPEANTPIRQSPKMDVYSYGVLLLEMCSRQFPDKDKHEDHLKRVKQAAMPELIRRCLQEAPEDRPAMSEILEQLQSAYS